MSGVGNVLGDMQGSYVPIAPRAAPAPQPAAPTPTPTQPAPAPAPQATSQAAHQAVPAAAPQQPDPLAPVMEKIARGESGGDYNARYGFPDLPGAPGPAGESHALGKYQFEPGTWERTAKEWMAAHPGSPQPDFNKPQDQEVLARFRAVTDYRQNTGGRDLVADAKSGTVDYSALAGTWPSLGKPNLKGFYGSNLSEEQQHELSAYSTDQKALIERMREHAAEYDRIANSSSPGDKDREQLISQMRAQSLEMQREWQQKVNSPPIQKPLDAWQAFGSPAVILGLLAGLVGRQHLTLGLTAAGAALQAINQNDEKTYQRQYETWKLQTELGLKTIDMQNQDIQQLLEDRRYSVDERRVRLETMAHELGFDQALASMGGDVYKYAAAAQNTAAQLSLRAATIQNTEAYRQTMAGLAAQRVGATGATALNQYGDPPSTTSADPNKPTPGSNIPQAVWDAATTYALTQKMPTLGNSAAGRAAILAATPWVFAARGMTPAGQVEQGIQYHGALAGQDTLSRRLANLNVGLSEVPHLGDQLVQVSDATPRSNFMPFNQLLQAAEYRTGDPQVVRLGAAMNSYMQAYARAVNPTGQVTDDIRAHVGAVMNQAMSRGQVSAGVDQLNQELRGMQQGLQDAQKAGQAMYPLPGEPKPAEQTSGPPTVSSQEQYDALPSGSTYIGPDGKQRTKR